MNEQEQLNKIVNALKALTDDEIDKLITSVGKSIEENKKNKLVGYEKREKNWLTILSLIETEINNRIKILK